MVMATLAYIPFWMDVLRSLLLSGGNACRYRTNLSIASAMHNDYYYGIPFSLSHFEDCTIFGKRA
uniref:Uncharacterized protein n=1 Tax=Rhizophora mucronata TaxID=61149 RepID=A0A2P2R3N2_RHIMU